jgi:hypothetical protein
VSVSLMCQRLNVSDVLEDTSIVVVDDDVVYCCLGFFLSMAEHSGLTTNVLGR